ncbi:MAG: C40 family peptidase, partial [Ruminiclostridium sp.]|nr:C40 family peptidase [Ruminiclostridium sp.]
FINCPRGAAEQASMGTHTDYDSLRKGDLVYFSTDDSGQADFGGIYLGDGQMIYCPYPEEDVQIVSISSDYWVNAFYIGVRLS